MAASSGVEQAADLVIPKGSNIDIGINFNPQGKLDSVKVDGNMVPLDSHTAAGAAHNGATHAAAHTEPVSAMHGISESIHRLLDAGASVWQDFQEYLPYLLLALAVLVLLVFVASAAKAGARKVMAHTGMRHSLAEVLSRFLYVLIWLAGGLLIAKLLFPNFELGTALTYLGIASLVAGFVFRDIFENAFAGLLILWRFPFEAGDYIEVETDPPVRGHVHDIWVRSTLIREFTDELIVVPNSKIYQHAVRVTTWLKNSRRSITVAVAYDEDLDKARAVISKAVKTCDSVKENPEVQVFARQFADSGVEFEVAWWSHSGPMDERRSRDDVLTTIRKALAAAKIEIPFPYRTLTFKPDYPLHRAPEANQPAPEQGES